MTSTSFNIGLPTEKNSSRVLRPPGGGHSDIFGVRDNQNELITPSKKRNYPQSTISSCFNMVDGPNAQTKPEDDDNPTNGEEHNGDQKEVDNGIDENQAPGVEIPEKESEKEKQAILSSKRGRVPPGGFSSGLW